MNCISKTSDTSGADLDNTYMGSTDLDVNKNFNIKTDININDIIPIIPADLFKIIRHDFSEILYNICINNKLDFDKILQDYSPYLSKLGAKYGIKQRNRKKLDPQNTCMGRKGDGNQCTRGRRLDSEYCKSHENNLPEGRIDEVYEKKKKIEEGKKIIIIIM